jgi:hypothetical protein
MFIKMDSCYCKRKTKRKVGSLWKLRRYYTTETLIIYCWGGELILSPIQMWIPPQPYIWSCFGCRYTWDRRWSSSIVLGVLRLKPDATIVMCWTMGVHSFVHFVYSLWHVCYLFFCISHSFVMYLYFVKP